MSDCVPGVEAGGGGELVRDVRDIVTVAQPAPLSSPLATSAHHHTAPAARGN